MINSYGGKTHTKPGSDHLRDPEIGGSSNITLDQVEFLSRHGYGDEIRKWTSKHAASVMARIMGGGRPRS